VILNYIEKNLRQKLVDHGHELVKNKFSWYYCGKVCNCLWE